MNARNSFDRDPAGTYRKMHKAIDEDTRNGYLSKREERKLRNAANRLYLQGKKKSGKGRNR